MGASSAPLSGFAPENFADDVGALVEASDAAPFVLFGHSMGVSIALEYALRRPAGLVALVLGDAPAQYIDFAAAGTFAPFFTSGGLEFDSWDDAYDRIGHGDRFRFDRMSHKLLYEDASGKVRAMINRDALAKTVEESRTAARMYWDRLAEIQVPVTLLLAADTRLSEDAQLQYRERLPMIDILRLPGGHDLGLGGEIGPLVSALNRMLPTGQTV